MDIGPEEWIGPVWGVEDGEEGRSWAEVASLGVGCEGVREAKGVWSGRGRWKEFLMAALWVWEMRKARMRVSTMTIDGDFNKDMLDRL